MTPSRREEGNRGEGIDAEERIPHRCHAAPERRPRASERDPRAKNPFLTPTAPLSASRQPSPRPPRVSRRRLVESCARGGANREGDRTTGAFRVPALRCAGPEPRAPKCSRPSPGGRSWHWGPPLVKRLSTSQPHPSPPRRRHCAQVRFRSIRVATTCEFPHPFFRARVDHHPTHHPPPPQIGPVGPTNQQGPRARVDARLARAPLGRLDSCNPRARRTRRFEVGRRRSAHVRVERRVSRRSSYHFTHPPNHHEHDSPAPDSRR